MANAFIVELLTSKKVVASVSAVLTVLVLKVAGKFGLVLDADTANQISVLVGVVTSAYLVSQGISDHQKGAVESALAAGADPNRVLGAVLGTAVANASAPTTPADPKS